MPKNIPKILARDCWQVWIPHTNYICNCWFNQIQFTQCNYAQLLEDMIIKEDFLVAVIN